MKKFLLFLGKILLCFCVVFPLLVSFLLVCPYKTYETSYQAVIQRKFDYLKNTKEKKIIIVGGSNASFGIDEEKIEEAPVEQAETAETTGAAETTENENGENA